MSTILIVDDEPQLRHALAINLSVRGYDVLEAGDGEAALERVAVDHPDLVLLDLGLPSIDGLSALGALRRWTDVPVIVVTARDDERTKVLALDAGADDYVTKPFGMGELLARLRASLRRASSFEEQSPVVETNWFTVDLANHTASAGQPRRPVSLTRLEWTIVDRVARHPGRLVTYRELIDHVWGPASTVMPRVLRVHLSSIRHKLERDSAHPEHFITDPMVGVRFFVESQRPRGTEVPTPGASGTP